MRRALLVVLTVAIMAVLLGLLLPRPIVKPGVATVSGDDCPTVDTSAAPSPESQHCWQLFANVGVFICPTEAHPDWLTALAPVCPPD